MIGTIMSKKPPHVFVPALFARAPASVAGAESACRFFWRQASSHCRRAGRTQAARQSRADQARSSRWEAAPAWAKWASHARRIERRPGGRVSGSVSPLKNGFSLIELLVVLAIAGVLASLAYPSYAAYMTRARRLEGKVALFDIMHQQENLYGRNNQYARFGADDGDGAGQGQGLRWWSGATAAASAYELHAQACAGVSLAQCVEVVAVPGTARVDSRFRDPACGALTLRSTGERLAETADPACWP